MSEGEWMEYSLAQVRSGARPRYSQLSDAELAEIDEEHIGEHFSRYPFLY